METYPLCTILYVLFMKQRMLKYIVCSTNPSILQRFGSTIVFRKRDRGLEHVAFRKSDLVSEGRSCFRISIAFWSSIAFEARHVWKERFSFRSGTVLRKTVRDFEDGSCIRSSVSTTCHHMMKYDVTIHTAGYHI
jgi:hypothetical protein